MTKNTLSQHYTYNTPKLEQADTRRTKRSDAVRFARTTSEMVGVRLVSVRKAAARAPFPRPPSAPQLPRLSLAKLLRARTLPDNKTARVINAEAKPAEYPSGERDTFFSTLLYFKELLILLSLSVSLHLKKINF
ncbi:jg10038 [Pararge aegeria aegeria]|uniref:Jg10038 protein n=1 Tax=Pararge aegeria aegeria TaxID=348720 RepID=A0A8S4S7H7_9NEOP|nr:jg10038 [Pararge aegeria aegeria]